ncbi:MAG: glycoside hydrolase family 28, partial [Paenibacillus sp.]|nr:glycoside hydrolase family 28 [Paenibacillus sp.]
MSNAEYNVRLFGAAGDGKTKDTFAIQQAIEACAASGGGRVVLPAGTYVSGTLFLKSNVELHLASGALLMGSPDQDDYNKTDLFPENTASARDFTSGAHLIIAYDQDNVSITGFGEINGNSSAFFGDLPPGKFATYRFKNGDHTLGPWRTGQMVFFCRCRRVAVHDIALRDSPYWTLFVHGCEDVQIRGLTITNPPGTRNGDGIDIDCSRYVRVSDCLIRTGDDCITVRGNKRPLGDYAQPCEHIIVTNCVLSSPCNAIRVGVGNGEVRDCLFS